MHPIIKMGFMTGNTKRRAGEVWSRITTDAVSKGVQYLFHHAGTWFAIGASGSYRSTDRVTWVSCSVAGSRMLKMAGALVFYYPGQATYTRTADLGVTTTTHSFPAGVDGSVQIDAGVIYNTRGWIGEDPRIFITADGVSWSYVWGSSAASNRLSPTYVGADYGLTFFAGCAFFAARNGANTSLFRLDSNGASCLPVLDVVPDGYSDVNIFTANNVLHVRNVYEPYLHTYTSTDGLTFSPVAHWGGGYKFELVASGDGRAIAYNDVTYEQKPASPGVWSEVVGPSGLDGETGRSLFKFGNQFFLATSTRLCRLGSNPSAAVWVGTAVSGWPVSPPEIVFDGTYMLLQSGSSLMRTTPASGVLSKVPGVTPLVAVDNGTPYKVHAFDGTRHLVYCQFSVYNAITKVVDVTYGFMESAGE